MRASRVVSCGLFGSLLGAGSFAHAQTGWLQATVLDSARTPVANAEVSIPKLGRVARTDSTGKITLSDIAPGHLEIAVRRINFFPEHFFIDVRSQETTSVEIELSGRASDLDAVNVTAAGHPFFAGFEERKAKGIGTFITRDKIDSQHTTTTSDLFRTLPMVHLVRTPSGMGARFPLSGIARGPRGGTCTPLLWVDGQKSPGLEIDDILATDIHAIELYRGVATTPAQFASANTAQCGAIVIWTRRRVR
jgi:hypothetical protein